MKRFFFIVLTILTLSIPTYAELVKEGNTFIEQTSKESDKELPFTYKDSKGQEHKLYMSKKGAIYMIKVSAKTGKEYKHYLPKDKQEHIKQHLSQLP